MPVVQSATARGGGAAGDRREGGWTRARPRRTVERRLRVVEVDGVRALLENVETGRRTRIALARMRQTAATRGFELEE